MCQRNNITNETECVSVCARLGQTECTCDVPSMECFVCCRESSGGSCTPAMIDNRTLPLSNGAGCSDDRVCIDVSCETVALCDYRSEFLVSIILSVDVIMIM